MTTSYFEASDEDDLRIVIADSGLLTTKNIQSKLLKMD
jgi:hypothetical protein